MTIMNRYIYIIVFLVIVIIIQGLFCINHFHKYDIDSSIITNLKPEKNGYIYDNETAEKVAEIILTPIYGDIINSEKPLHAKLLNDSIWVIEGSLKKGEEGGVAHIEISKRDCRIITIFHSK
jgi:choline kinase